MCGDVERTVFSENANQDHEEPHKKEASDEIDQSSLSYDYAVSSDDSDGGVSLSSSPPAPAEPSKRPHTDLRLKGMQRAKNREMVRQAGRRGATLGFLSWEEGRERMLHQVEAVQNGRVVEASFAKGEWGVRWKS